jgi:hypothetical protein
MAAEAAALLPAREADVAAREADAWDRERAAFRLGVSASTPGPVQVPVQVPPPPEALRTPRTSLRAPAPQQPQPPVPPVTAAKLRALLGAASALREELVASVASAAEQHAAVAERRAARVRAAAEAATPA